MSVRPVNAYEYECDLCGTKSTVPVETPPPGWVAIGITPLKERHVCKTCTLYFFRKAEEMFGFPKRPESSLISHYATRQADPHA